jgi:hypothetical protein
LVVGCSCDLTGSTRLGPIGIFRADSLQVSFDNMLLNTTSWADVLTLSWNGSTCSDGKQNEDPQAEQVDERRGLSRLATKLCMNINTKASTRKNNMTYWFCVGTWAE